MTRDMLIETDGGVTYPVVVGEGCAVHSSENLPDDCPAVALVTDSNLARLHAARVAASLGDLRVITLEFPAGEQHKNRRNKEAVEDAMIEAGLGRDCCVVALGGGVSTDLGGFVAGTFMRGVPWIALPTSLLAAVDASVGGKTGVDTDQGKNLIGVFHQPRAVLIDLELMATLPGEEIANGLAEMAKHAVVADERYLADLVQDAQPLRDLEPDALERAIARSVEIKGAIVAADTGERDYRQVLNLGHTIGHAIETVSGYALGHGLAVAAGLSVECGIASRLGLMSGADRDRVRAALERLGLPTAPPDGLEIDALLAAISRDKKGRAGKARYALPSGIGQMARGAQGWAREVPDDLVRAAIAEV